MSQRSQQGVGEELAEIIREEIRAKGPIPFSRWMELCLYHPVHGYYMRPGRKTGAGRDADFVTPPTLHPFFARCVARELAAAWRRMGAPASFSVAEWGGGEGDLAREAIRFLDEREPRLSAGITWTHVEPSPEHRARQRSLDGRLHWRGPDDVQRPDAAVLCEVLDAVPFDIVEWDGSSWQEVVLQRDGPRFTQSLRPARGDPDVELLGSARRAAGGLAPLGLVAHQRVTDQRQARALFEQVCDATQGLVLVADYMDWPRSLYDGSRLDGTVRGYRSHDLADVMAAPGATDITATVDIVQVTRTRGAMWQHDGDAVESMEEFLLRHGILEELNAIDRSTVEGASSYLRLRQLLLPTGMGAAFKVMRLERAAA